MALTPAQQLAVETCDRPVAVIASAGSGKTRVLTEHYRHLVSQLNVPVPQILAFTFTEKAAAEIKHRVVNEGIVPPDAEPVMHISTIHSFLALLLRTHSMEIGLNPEFRVMDEVETSLKKGLFLNGKLNHAITTHDPFITEQFYQWGYQKTYQIFHSLFQCVIPAETGISRVTAGDSRFRGNDIAQQWLERAQALKNEWLGENVAAGLITFDDLESLTLKIFRAHPSIARQMHTRFTHILVDECQDIATLEGEIIQALHSPGTNQLFLVGDPKQSIYRFRGANPYLFRRLIQVIEESGGAQIALSETFRIAPELACTIDSVFGPLFMEDSSIPYHPMVSQVAGEPGQFTIVVIPPSVPDADAARRAESRWIAEHIESLRLPPGELQQTALLFRSASFMGIYAEALKARGIPCHIHRTQSLFGDPVIGDLMLIIDYLAGPVSLILQTGILRSCFFHFSEAFIAHYTRLGPKNFKDHNTPDLFTEESDTSEWGRLMSLIRQWEVEKAHLAPTALVKRIWNAVKDATAIFPQSQVNMAHWMELIHQWEGHRKMSLKEMASLLQWMRDGDEIVKILEIKKSAQGVHLLTIHAAKGLEFNRVYLPQIHAAGRKPVQDWIMHAQTGMAMKEPDPQGIGGLKVRLVESPLFEEIKEMEAREEREEAKRLLYVAMTRARYALTVFLKDPKKKKMNFTASHQWNDWLWQLIPRDRAQVIALKEGDVSQSSSSNLADPRPSSPWITPLQPPAGARDDYRFKPTHTISSIESFLRCGKEYELKYIHNLEPMRSLGNSSHAKFPSKRDHIPATSWGGLIHEVFCFLDLKTLANTDTVIEQALANQKFNGDTKKVTRLVKETMNALLSHPEIHPLLTTFEQASTELPILADEGPFYLQGTIDRLSFHNGHWTIIDYKTDTIKSPHELGSREAAYEGQMMGYALAAQKLLGVAELTTALIFTHGPYLRMQTWNEEKFGKARNAIHRIHQSLSAGMGFAYPSDRSICRHCRYYENNYCGVKNEN